MRPSRSGTSGSRWRTAFGSRPASTSPDARDPCPVLLEALPYRKDDVTAGDREEYRRLAGEHGYAVARVDLRGTGSSEASPPTSTRRRSRPTSAG